MLLSCSCYGLFRTVWWIYVSVSFGNISHRRFMFIHHRAGTVEPVLRPHLQGAHSHPIFIKETSLCKLKDFLYAADCPRAHLPVWYGCGSSGIGRCVVGWVVSDILKDCCAFVFEDEFSFFVDWLCRMFETTCPTKWHHIPEHLNLQQCDPEDLESCVIRCYIVFQESFMLLVAQMALTLCVLPRSIVHKRKSGRRVPTWQHHEQMWEWQL